MSSEFRQTMRVYRRLLGYARPYAGQLAGTVVAMLGVAATTALAALLIKNVLDDVFVDKNRTMLLLVPAGIVVLYLFKAVFQFVRTYVMNAVGVRMVRDIRNQLYGQLHRLSMSYFTETPTGTLMSRVTYDVAMIQGAITEALTGAIKDVFTVIGLAAVVMYRSPLLGTIILVGFPVAFYPMVRFGRKMKRASRQSQQQMGELSKLMQERISGMGLVKAFGAEETELARFGADNQALTESFLGIQRVRSMAAPVMEFIGAGSVAVIILVGGSMVMKGSMTVGEFFSFLAALMMLYEPVKHMASVNNMIQQGVAAAERVFEILDLSPDVTDRPGAGEMPRVQGHIRFESVSFRYGRDWVLREVSLDIPRGTRLAIVGTSGGGKTTLVNLIPRFYDVTEGAVTIDGIDVRSVTQKSLRRQVSIVSQEVVLFNETIRSNLCYGMEGIDDERIDRALQAAYAHDFVASLPQGLDTVVGERGTRLSGGQRQRLSIARAILKDSPILILDEATSSLDTESEFLVQRALENLIRGRTTLAIAHRISTVRDADLIIVLSGGRVVERGRHAELVALGGEYSRLYSLLVTESEGDGGEATGAS